MTLEDLGANTLIECFEYLDAVRASGVANMFKSQDGLQIAMNLTPSESHLVLLAWMEFVGGNLSARERVESAIRREVLLGGKG